MSETKRGEFWIDGDDTCKVQGTLTYGSDILSTLDLSGHLGEREAGMQNILGELEGQQCVTLRNCFVTSTTSLFMPGTTQKYICNDVFKGKLMFLNGEQIYAESLTVSMSPLVEWSREKNLVEFDWPATIWETQSANFLPNECITIQGCRSETLDFTVEIWRSAGLITGENQKGKWLKAEPRSWFKLVPSGETPVESLIALVPKLQLMLTMLVNVPAVVNQVSFRTPFDVEPGQDWIRDVEFFTQWERDARGEDDARLRIYDSVFMCQAGQDITRKWFTLHDDYHPAVNWLLLSHYFTPPLRVDMRFDAAFKSVERLLSQSLGTGRPRDRKGRNYRKGESRASATSLARFIECAGLSGTRYFKNMDCAARREWASHVMEMRDKHTAHLDWGGTLQPPEGKEFHQQATVLTCLGVGFLMAQMNIPSEVIRDVLDRRLLDAIVIVG